MRELIDIDADLAKIAERIRTMENDRVRAKIQKLAARRDCRINSAR